MLFCCLLLHSNLLELTAKVLFTFLLQMIDCHVANQHVLGVMGNIGLAMFFPAGTCSTYEGS